MQKQRSARSSLVRNKLYINENNLNVTGEKIKLLRFPDAKSEERAAPTIIIIDRQPPPPTTTTNKGPSKTITETEERAAAPQASTERRRFHRLATTNYENPHVCHPQLKEIYESVQVGDFKRIIKTLGPKSKGNAARNAEINCVDPAAVYRAFFESHQDSLRDAIAKQTKNQ